MNESQKYSIEIKGLIEYMYENHIESVRKQVQ